MSTLSRLVLENPPTNIVATPVSSSAITLTWTANPRAITYRVYRNGVALGYTQSLTYPDTGLQPSTSYTYTVATVGIGIAYDLEGPQSVGVSASTLALTDTTAPTVPGTLTATAVSASQINLAWGISTDTGGSGLAGYKLERSNNGSTGWAQIYQGTANSYSDTGLTAATQRYYRVRAYDNATPTNNNSAYGNTANATTQAGTAQSINVSTAAALLNAMATANANPANTYTINLANGTYTMTDALYVNVANVTIQSTSGTASAVIIQGDAISSSAAVPFNVRVAASGFTALNVTFGGRCRFSAVQIVGESGANNGRLSGCIIRDSYEHLVKGTTNGTTGASGWIFEDCQFLFTAGQAPAQYNGGIDMHRATNPIVRRCTFRDIASPASSACQHAIAFWNGGTNCLIERNKIIDCDRGIGSGLSATTTFGPALANSGDIIRNNQLYHSANSDAFADVQISVENSLNARVFNNTVYVANSFPWAMEYRFTTTGTEFRNNLCNKGIQQRDGATATLANNITNAQASYFVNLSTGDLDLASSVSGVVDAGATLTGFSDDYGGTARPQGSAWDIGADELIPPVSFESIRHYNTGYNSGDVDRVKFLATNATALGNLWGTGEHTLEIRIRPVTGNTAGTVATGSGQYTWITGNIIVDRDRYNQNPGWGLSLTDGRITFGVKNSNGSYTARGTSDLRLVTTLTHVAVQRNATTGQIQVWVNGTREINVTGPTGSLAYPSGATPLSLCGPSGTDSCSFSDPYIVIGAEKHNAAGPYPGMNGIWTEFRLSDVARYSGASITVPSARFTNDANTIGLYDTRETSGTQVLDKSANANHGEMMVGGPNNGPTRTTEAPVYSGGPSDPLDLPLATDQNLSITYLGYFSVPLTYFNGGMSITEDGTQIYANTGNTESLARISVPSIGGTAALQIAGTGISGNLGGNGAKSVTGSLQVGNSLLISRSIDYDANFEQSTWIKRANLNIGSQGTMCGMSGGGPRNLSQGLGRVPTIWQSALGGNTFTLGSRMSIISAAQCGYGFGTFNHENVLQGGGTVTVNKLLNYTSGAAGQNWNNALEPIPANPNYSSYPKNSSGGTDWFSETNAPVGTAIIPEGSRSLLYFTTHGYGPSGGQPSCRVGSSVHNGPYRCQIVAYDLRDLVDVRNGLQSPSQPRPYTYDVTNNRRWGSVPNTDALFGNCAGRISAQPGNACYDPATRRLYWAPNGWDEGAGSQRLHVWQIGTVA